MLANVFSTLPIPLLQTPVECREWDDRFLFAFHAALLVGAILWLLLLVLAPQRPRWWWRTRPYGRALVASVVGALLVTGIIVLSLLPNPSLLLRFLDIPIAYVDTCSEFGARGFLWGIGAERTAIHQLGPMSAIAATFFGGLLAASALATAFFGRYASPWRLERPKLMGEPHG